MKEINSKFVQDTNFGTVGTLLESIESCFYNRILVNLTYFLCKKCNLWRYYQWSNHTFLFLLGLEKVIKILQKVYYPSLSAVSTFYNATFLFYDTNSTFQNHLYMAKHSNGYPKLKFPKRRQSICIGSLHYEANMKNEEGMCSMNNISQAVHKVS